MAEYIARRIIDGALSYPEVISRRPDLRGKIDAHLVDKGYNIKIQSPV